MTHDLNDSIIIIYKVPCTFMYSICSHVIIYVVVMATHKEVLPECVPAPAGVVGQSVVGEQVLNRQPNTHTLIVTEIISCMMTATLPCMVTA